MAEAFVERSVLRGASSRVQDLGKTTARYISLLLVCGATEECAQTAFQHRLMQGMG